MFALSATIAPQQHSGARIQAYELAAWFLQDLGCSVRAWIVFMNLAAYYKFIVPRMNGADVGPISADIPQYLGIVFGPVLLVLVIGAVVTWMLSGFKRA